MKEYLERLPRDILELIYTARDIAQEMNCRAYLIGGFVRDLILGVDNLDVDIAIEANGISFAEVFASRLEAKLIVHKRFGTATINLKHHAKIDITTLRKEFYPQPGSLPVVSNGVLKDDLARRDFSINALAVSISGEDFGKLIDLFSGENDLRRKKIRILHEISFIDDPTRILRAIRFEKRYDFKIEPSTLSRLKEAARLGMLEKLEPQRVRDELILALREKRPFKQIARIQELAGLKFINHKLHFSKKEQRLFLAIEKEIESFQGLHH